MTHGRLALPTLSAAALAVCASAHGTAPTPPTWWLKGPGACIRQWESGDGRTSSNLYGMLDGWAVSGGHGSAWAAPRREQDYRAFVLWKRYGWQPWRGQTAERCEP